MRREAGASGREGTSVSLGDYPVKLTKATVGCVGAMFQVIDQIIL